MAVTLHGPEYEEFIEAWVHEIKTPLSLAMLILYNRRDEMSPLAHQRFEHVRHTISADVGRILYYARLQYPIAISCS